MPPSIQLNDLHLKTIFYSFFLHIIILGLFVFVIPLKKASNKPSFVFLGSIFQNDAFINFSSNQNNASSVLLTPTANLIWEHQAPYDDRSVSKPIYLDAIKSSPKISPKKLDMPAVITEKNANPKTIDNLYLPALPAYKPLRFQTE